MGYFKTAIFGTSWLVALRAIIRSLTFVRLLVLARLLTPGQFGAFGVATLVLAFIEVLTETGVNIVMVQEDRASFRKYLDSAWVVSILRGVLIGSIIFLSAPIVSDFFSSPESLPLLLLISLVPLIKGFINPSIVLYQKELHFKKEMLFRSSIVVVGTIVTIVAALVLRSPVSLLVGMLVEAVLEVVLSFLLFAEKPKFSFERERFLYIFNRGKWITLAGVFNYLYQQLDDIVVGRKLLTANLGYYQMAYRLAMLPITELTDVSNRVTFPVYTRIGGDPNRLQRAFFKTLGLIALFSTMFALLLSSFPEQIVEIVLGSQWLLVVPPLLPILAATGALRSISVACYPLFLAQKKQEYVMYTTLMSILVLGVLIVPFTWEWGLQGAAIAALAGTLAAVPISGYFVFRILRFGATSR